MTPDRTRPSSPIRGGHSVSSRPLPGPLHIAPNRDPLRLFPTDISQNIFSHLSVRDLASCALVSRKWSKSQTINFVWYQHNRAEKFGGKGILPGKWTRRESKQNWRVTHLRFIIDQHISSTPSSGYSTPFSVSGTQTPLESVGQWEDGRDNAVKPAKAEMRYMYKELRGRKSRDKTKFGNSGIRDRGGWAEGHSD